MSLEQRINYQLNKYPGVKNVPGKAKALYSFLKMGLKSFFYLSRRIYRARRRVNIVLLVC